MVEKEGIIEVSRIIRGKECRKETFYITVQLDTIISMDIKDVELERFLDELSREMGLNIITYGELTGVVNANVENQPIDKVLELVLTGTKYGYKKLENIYIVGSTEAKAPEAPALSSITLIPLKYSMAEEALKLLPPTLPEQNIKVVKVN
jgi:type II secretory pathway component GspD/PulD (secretin)